MSVIVPVSDFNISQRRKGGTLKSFHCSIERAVSSREKVVMIVRMSRTELNGLNIKYRLPQA